MLSRWRSQLQTSCWSKIRSFLSRMVLCQIPTIVLQCFLTIILM
jgi:hypothetical protein